MILKVFAKTLQIVLTFRELNQWPFEPNSKTVTVTPWDVFLFSECIYSIQTSLCNIPSPEVESGAVTQAELFKLRNRNYCVIIIVINKRTSLRLIESLSLSQHLISDPSGGCVYSGVVLTQCMDCRNSMQVHAAPGSEWWQLHRSYVTVVWLISCEFASVRVWKMIKTIQWTNSNLCKQSSTMKKFVNIL